MPPCKKTIKQPPAYLSQDQDPNLCILLETWRWILGRIKNLVPIFIYSPMASWFDAIWCKISFLECVLEQKQHKCSVNKIFKIKANHPSNSSTNTKKQQGTPVENTFMSTVLRCKCTCYGTKDAIHEIMILTRFATRFLTYALIWS